MIRERVLKVVLVLVGLLFLAGAYPLTELHRPDLVGEQMLGGVYASLGVFLLLASRRPSANRSLIAFTAWSSLIHAGVMVMQGMVNLIPHEDMVKAGAPLSIIGIALIVLAPAKLLAVAADRHTVGELRGLGAEPSGSAR